MIFTIIGALIIVIIIIVVINAYNGLVDARNNVRNAWAQIDVQLVRRTDLIPDLVETVKEHSFHENDILENVINARNRLVNASLVFEKNDANNAITDALRSLFVVVDDYPDLKDNQKFLNLKRQLFESENKISYSKQFYNDAVLSYNNKRQKFPYNIIASLRGFKKEEFFKSPLEAHEVPEIQF